MKSLWKTSCLFNLFDVQYEMWKKWHIGECVIGPEIHDFVYICKGYIEFHLKNPVGIDAYWVLRFYKSAKIL